MLKVAGHSYVGDRDEAETRILDSTAEHTRDGLVNTILNFALACFVCHGTPLFLLSPVRWLMISVELAYLLVSHRRGSHPHRLNAAGYLTFNAPIKTRYPVGTHRSGGSETRFHPTPRMSYKRPIPTSVTRLFAHFPGFDDIAFGDVLIAQRDTTFVAFADLGDIVLLAT